MWIRFCYIIICLLVGKPCSVLKFDMLLKVPRFSKASRNLHGWHLPSLHLLPSVNKASLSPTTLQTVLSATRTLHSMDWCALALLELSRNSLSNHQYGTKQCCQECQQKVGKGWFLHTLLPSRISVQKVRETGMPTCSDAHRQLTRVCIGMTEAVAYLQLVYGAGPMCSVGRLTGLRNFTQYPNAVVLWGKYWSHCERTVLLPSPSSSWIHPRKASPQDMPPVAGRC